MTTFVPPKVRKKAINDASSVRQEAVGESEKAGLSADIAVGRGTDLLHNLTENNTFPNGMSTHEYTSKDLSERREKNPRKGHEGSVAWKAADDSTENHSTQTVSVRYVWE